MAKKAKAGKTDGAEQGAKAPGRPAGAVSKTSPSEVRVKAAALRKGEAKVREHASRLERLVVEYVDIEAVKPNDYNPNRQSTRDFDLLCRSISEDGFTQPVVAQRSTRVIVDGEHRWRAARQLGMVKVPVVFVDMSDEQMRIATLRHNRARGSEDVELGIQVLRDLRELGALDWAQDSLQIDDRELSRLLADIPVADALAGEEYTEGWEPTDKTADGTDLENNRRAVTDAAQEAQDKIQAQIDKASSPEERAQLETQFRNNLFRVNVVFRDEDAELVKRILEPKPAEKLLALCLAELALAEQEADEAPEGAAG